MERLSNFQRFMATNDEQCISIPIRSHVKSSSISKSVLQIYQQNTQGIKWKSDEILDFFYPVFPHLVCITEHHLNQCEIVQFHICNYALGANYCRHSLKKGGACIFFHNSLSFVGIIVLYHLFSFRRSVQHYKIHMDIKIVTFLGIGR